MAITNETVSWTNAASAGTDWQGIEVACSAGAEFDVQGRNMSATGSGEVLIGARMLANYGASGSVFNYRFVIGTVGSSSLTGILKLLLVLIILGIQKIRFRLLTVPYGLESESALT
ncbi:TPA: hypothetical protein ACOEP6_000892 [Enterobacter ludwigii]